MDYPTISSGQFFKEFLTGVDFLQGRGDDPVFPSLMARHTTRVQSPHLFEHLHFTIQNVSLTIQAKNSYDSECLFESPAEKIVVRNDSNHGAAPLYDDLYSDVAAFLWQ